MQEDDIEGGGVGRNFAGLNLVFLNNNKKIIMTRKRDYLTVK